MSKATKIIYCYRSGVPLATVTAVCTQGWPLLNTINATLLHPIYGMPTPKLILKLDEHLQSAHAADWCVDSAELQEIRLCMSAMMYSLDAIWQAPPESNAHVSSLPSEAVAAGSAARLLGLVRWHHYMNTSRIVFPLYNISQHNNNLAWENIKDWLDLCDEIKEDWESGRNKLSHDEEKRRREAALLSVKAEHIYKRIDFNKVWNWIDIQLAEDEDYPAGRRETFKSLFMRGDVSPEDWTTDDVDDLIEAILLCCDCGNEITHFIHTRLSHIRSLIIDFYSSFTLLSAVTQGPSAHPDLTEEERERQDAFFNDYDARAQALEELPPEPKREHFASNALFLKAQAQHRILARRFNMSTAKSTGV